MSHKIKISERDANKMALGFLGKDYFNGTDDQAEIIADYLESMGHDRVNEGGTLMGDLLMIETYSGDTEVRVLYENAAYLVYISRDSGIEVINVVNKQDYGKSVTVEI